MSSPTAVERERHYAPLQRVLAPDAARQFQWKAETGSIQSYQHESTLRNIHIDGATGQFYDQDRNPVTARAAIAHAMPANSPTENTLLSSVLHSGPVQGRQQFDQGQGYGL